MTSNERRAGSRPGRAVVIGGSVAGLFCARALADHFGEVIVVERDVSPEGPAARKGAPQMRHAHGVLADALRILQLMFPGILEEMKAEGALLVDAGRDLAMYHYGAWKARINTGIEAMTCSRPFFEWHVRRRAAAVSGVQIRYQHAVEDLAFEQGRVTGVRVKGASGEETLSADLVVDASGRGTRVPRWLDALGYGRPEAQEVGVDLAYASRIYELPEELEVDWAAVAVYTRPPGHRGGFVFLLEGRRAIVSLPGYFGDHCPTSEEGFHSFARSLPVPVVADFIRDARPVTDIVTHKLPSSRWYRYDKMARLPDGLVMVGDSVCSLNPTYGQGMMVAAQGASALAAALASRPRSVADLRGFSRLFQERLAGIIKPAWMLSTTMDLRFPQATGKRPPGIGLLQWTFTNLIDMTNVNRQACRIFYDVLHARRGMEALADRRVLLPLLAHCIKSPFVPGDALVSHGPVPPPPA